MNNANEADITLIVGASGSGKSLRARRLVDGLVMGARLPVLIWDWKREYADIARPCHTLAEFVRQVRLGGRSGRALAYRPKRDKNVEQQFNAFCAIALALGNCGVLVEELSFVTRSGWSPGKWREIITTGRAEGLHVIGTTQSPALVDKTCFTSCTTLCVGRLEAKSHKVAMADALDLSPDALRSLRDLEWIVKTRGGVIKRETIAVPQANPFRRRPRLRVVSKPKAAKG